MTMQLLDSNSIEFDTAFTFDGEAITELVTPYVPPVYIDDEGLIVDHTDWEPIAGRSGQHGYPGPIMHPSEQFSPNVLEAMHRDHGSDAVYAITEVLDNDDPDNLVGWIILRRLFKA